MLAAVFNAISRRISVAFNAGHSSAIACAPRCINPCVRTKSTSAINRWDTVGNYRSDSCYAGGVGVYLKGKTTPNTTGSSSHCLVH